MPLRLPLALLVATFPLAAQAPTSAAATAATERSAAGAYTVDQAARGDTAYQTFCASCHTTSYHTDEQFRSRWFGRTAYELFKTLKTTMPDDNPGSLSDADYTRVITYIFKLNGFPAGTDSLSTDSLALKTVRIRPAQPDSVKQNPR